MAKANRGSYLNTNGFFTVPKYETVAQTTKRLAEGEQQRWPGSISIHGHMKTSPGNNKRDHERTTPRAKRSERTPVNTAKLLTKIEQRFIEDACNYAEADRSDPFAFSVAMSHLKTGIAKTSDDGRSVHYRADRTTETRVLENGMQFSDGSNEFQVVAYRNIERP